MTYFYISGAAASEPSVFEPNIMRAFKLGRKRPLSRPPMLRLSNYLLRGATPPPPVRGDYAGPALNRDGLENVLHNDTLGCCTISGIGHIIDVFHANAGTGLSVTSDQVIALYEAACGYNPSDPSTDQGGDEITVLNYWRDRGIDGNGLYKSAGYVSVNAADPVELRTAIWLFGNVYWGIELPDAWVSPFPSASGFTWDVAGDPNPNNGHCVISYGYNENGPFIDTWGIFGTMTDAACAKYAAGTGGGECYAILSQDWIKTATGESPSGFAFAQLQADLAALA